MPPPPPAVPESPKRTPEKSAACRLGLTSRDVTVHMPGGNLQIQILPDESVFMTGRVGSIGTMVLSDRFAEELRSLETEIVPGERA